MNCSGVEHLAVIARGGWQIIQLRTKDMRVNYICIYIYAYTYPNYQQKFHRELKGYICGHKYRLNLYLFHELVSQKYTSSRMRHFGVG